MITVFIILVIKLITYIHIIRQTAFGSRHFSYLCLVLQDSKGLSLKGHTTHTHISVPKRQGHSGNDYPISERLIELPNTKIRQNSTIVAHSHTGKPVWGTAQVE